MRARPAAVASTATLITVLMAAPIAAQAPPGGAPGATPGATPGVAPVDSSVDSSVDTTVATPRPRPFTLSAYVDASYHHAPRSDGVVLGRVYDRRANARSLHAVKVQLERAPAADRFDIGGRADLVYGRNAALLRSNALGVGADGDVTQLYLSMNVPVGARALRFKAGRMATLLGVEVIETIANPNWSEGLQFAYAENFTDTGLEASYRLNPVVEAQLRVVKAWDLVRDNNDSRTVMARVGITPNDRSSIAIVAFSGVEAAGTSARRSGAELVGTRTVGRASLAVQLDYGVEGKHAALPDPTRDASWWALGTWATVPLLRTTSLALRLDHLDDANGARTAGAFGLAGAPHHRLSSGTVTLNFRWRRHLLLRPEVRYDHSSSPVFDGRRGQVTGAGAVAIMF